MKPEEFTPWDKAREAGFVNAIKNEEKFGILWKRLKESTIRLPDGTIIKNPFNGRYQYPDPSKPDRASWIQQVREACECLVTLRFPDGSLFPSVFANSPWDYKQILADEIALQELEASPEVVAWIVAAGRSKDQHFDEEQRRFTWILMRWILRQKISPTEVEQYFEDLLNPADLSKATPYNYWYFRFPEYCPSLPFYQFATSDGIQKQQNVSLFLTSLLHLRFRQLIKKKWSQFKASQLKKMKTKANDPDGVHSAAASRLIMRMVKMVLPGSETSNGLRAYTNSEQFKNLVVGERVVSEMEAIREAAGDPDRIFTSRELWSIGEQVKNQEWAQLTEAERHEWSQKARDLSGKWKELSL